MKKLFQQYLSEFAFLKPEEINSILENTSIETFKKGSVLLREGEIARKCYFVLSGCIRQYKYANEKETTIEFYTERETILSYTSYMNSIPSEYYLSCLEDSTLVSGTKEQEEIIQKQCPNLKSLSNIFIPVDYSRTEKHLSSIVNSTPEERYKSLLDTRPELLNRVPLNLIATYIGITPESLSRIRKRFLKN